MSFSKYLPVYRKNLVLAVPVIFSQIGQVTVNLVDNMMVGHLGTTELAAASFANNVFLIGMLFGIGFTLGLTPLVGQSLRLNNKRSIGAWLRNGVLVHGIVSIILGILMSFVVFFMEYMGQREDVVQLAAPYYLIHVFSLIPLLIFFSIKQFYEGIGNTKIAMVITIIVNVVNVGLNYILIYGKLGFPEFGLNGSACASLISRMLMPVIFIGIVFRVPQLAKYMRAARCTTFEKEKIKKIIHIGVPIGLQSVIEVLSFSFGAVMLGWISKEAIAGHQVAMGLISMTYLISFGLASGTTIRVSHAFGDKNRTELRQTILASVHIVLAFMSLMGILFILFRNQLPLLFTSDPEVVKIASKLFVVAAFFQIFDGMQVVLLGALRGMADVRIPMFMAFFSYMVICLPVSYLLAFVLNIGFSGVWIGWVFGLSIAALLFGFRLIKQLRAF